MSDTEEILNSQNDAGPNVLFVEENSRYKLTFRLQNSQMECLAEIEVFPAEQPSTEKSLPIDVDQVAVPDQADDKVPGAAIETSSEQLKPMITPPEIFWFLQQNNIIQTIDYAAVYDFCAAIEMGLAPDATILANGVEPVRGADGWFELTVKTSGEEAEFEEDEEGNVDLRNLHAYSEIEAGQKLGLVHPPKDGVPGIDVLGLPVPAERGSTFDLIAGEGVTLKFDNRVAFAEKSGRALFDKQTLSVVDQLIISGDIDLSIGNINFNGFVEIKGEVPDDFNITATKGIKIAGTVGACHLESAGSVEISSMAGKEIGRIVCHGDIHANYLNQVTVFCYGNVYVTREIRNSQIKSTGKVIVEQGAIIGGKCTAMEGIEAKTLGTSSGQKSQFIAGIYFPDADRFEYLHEQLNRVNRQIHSINEALRPLKLFLQKEKGDAETAKLRLSLLTEKLLKLQEEKDRLDAEISASTPQNIGTTNPKINILNELKEGCSITLGKTTAEIKIGLSGPMSIIENTRDGGLRYLTLSPMPVMAKQLEEEIIAESDVEIPAPE
ncbi:MAG: FapA family protein [Desulfuromusa sp.]|nr:FapA family protein [Desulfuromusa sp.]